MIKTHALLALLLLIVTGCSTDNNGNTTVIPLAPANLTATVISTTLINLQWKDNSTNEVGYKIQRKIAGANFADVGSTGTDAVTYSDINLAPNTTYTYRVYSYNSAGNSLQYSNEVTVTTNLIPIITTSSISDTTATTATCGGNISSDAGSLVTSKGVCWSTTSGPTVALGTKTTDGTGTGSFSSNITGLSANTTYYVRAYATNANGTAYGNEVSFRTTPDITTGLVGYWPFNGNSNDESGNGNHGTVIGAILSQDRFGNASKAYSFDGVDDNIYGQLLNPIVTTGNGLTLCSWINFPVLNSLPQINLVDSNGSGYGIWSNVINGNIVFNGLCGNAFAPTTMQISDINSPATNTWYSVILTCDLTTNNSKLYINGVIVGDSNSPLLQASIDLFTFGKWPGNNVYLTGKLDDIRIYNRALTQAEITYLATH